MKKGVFANICKMLLLLYPTSAKSKLNKLQTKSGGDVHKESVQVSAAAAVFDASIVGET